MDRSQKSIAVLASGKSVQSTTDLPGEETEIVAHVSIPKEGGLGWIIVFGSFMNFVIMDGICFSFGSLIQAIADDLGLPISSVSMINSFSVGVYFLGGPICSSFANRFGFRACSMMGASISAFAYFLACWGHNIIYLYFFYGVLAGSGFSLINVASSLVVGFNFDKYRALASGISTVGTSLGIMTISVLTRKSVAIDGWRTAVLLQSSALACIFFLSMTFIPLQPITVRKAPTGIRNESVSRTVTYLPSVSQKYLTPKKSLTIDSKSDSRQAVVEGTVAEKIFGAAGNENYPKSIAVVQEGEPESEIEPSSSRSDKATYEVVSYGKENKSIRADDLSKIKFVISETSSKENEKIGQSTLPCDIKQPSIEITKKRSWWKRIFHWEPEKNEIRPLYREDAFFHADIKTLPEYEKSFKEGTDVSEAEIIYALEVSRSAGTQDLQERKGLFTTAMRRVLATMLDPSMLKKGSFLFYCLGNLFYWVGYSVPLVYLPDWVLLEGGDKTHSDLIISVIGLANLVGRLIFSVLGSRWNGLIMSFITLIISGASLCTIGLNFSMVYQYVHCCIFGACISSLVALRCVILVDLYGLEKLTNTTGITLVFWGIGTLLGAPLAGLLITNVSYIVGFCFAGLCIILSGLCMLVSLIFYKFEKSVN